MSNVLLNLTVPSGIRVIPLLGIAQQQNAGGDAFQQIGDGDGAAITIIATRTSAANERTMNLTCERACHAALERIAGSGDAAPRTRQ